MNRFTLNLNDTLIWNYKEFLSFLVNRQGQHITIETHAEGVCLSSLGVYDILDMFNFLSVTIVTDNVVETHSKYNIALIKQRFRFLQVPPDTNYSQYQHWNKNTVYGAFYNRPTWSRIGLASHLLACYPAQSTVNVRYNPSSEDQRRYFELDKLFLAHPESVKNFMSIYTQLPKQLEDTDGYTCGVTTQVHTDQLAKFYPNFLIDIVSETFITGRTFFPTEKTIRPMLLKKPFIVMGPTSFLIHLRQLGFKTFNNFWDEGYDGHEGLHRYIKILDLIDTIANKSTIELEDMYTRMQPILEHNHNLLITCGYSTEVTYSE